MADQGSEGILSPFLRVRRRETVTSHLKGKVLDVGCGNGHLARLVPASSYLGVEHDPETLAKARKSNPEHRFQSSLPPAEPKFDSIVGLAVIEHIPDPLRFLGELKSRLSDNPESRIILTTPHPWTDSIHTAGALVGLFSRAASREHQSLLGYRTMKALAEESGLEISRYQRFLLGANQLFVLVKSPDQSTIQTS